MRVVSPLTWSVDGADIRALESGGVAITVKPPEPPGRFPFQVTLTDPATNPRIYVEPGLVGPHSGMPILLGGADLRNANPPSMAYTIDVTLYLRIEYTLVWGYFVYYLTPVSYIQETLPAAPMTIVTEILEEDLDDLATFRRPLWETDQRTGEVTNTRTGIWYVPLASVTGGRVTQDHGGHFFIHANSASGNLSVYRY
jgi:hypothetical protein